MREGGMGGHTCSTEVTEVRVTLPHGQEARAVLGVAGATTATARKPVWAVHIALAILLTEVV